MTKARLGPTLTFTCSGIAFPVSESQDSSPIEVLLDLPPFMVNLLDTKSYLPR